jgi:hypothetical protein
MREGRKLLVWSMATGAILSFSWFVHAPLPTASQPTYPTAPRLPYRTAPRPDYRPAPPPANRLPCFEATPACYDPIRYLLIK